MQILPFRRRAVRIPQTLFADCQTLAQELGMPVEALVYDALSSYVNAAIDASIETIRGAQR